MRLRYEPSITFGAIVQVIVLTTGLIGAWFDIRTRVNDHERRLVFVENMETQLSLTQADIAKNLSVLTAIVNERTHSIH